jgi:Fur family ferric uptake transcriptional regulator
LTGPENSYILVIVIIIIIIRFSREEIVLSHKKTRMSKQRKVILQVLEKSDGHPTADDVYNAVRKKLPRISLGTVYRNLEILSSAGKIQRVQLGGPQMRFDTCLEDHAHIRCLECGRIDDIPIDPLNPCEDDIHKHTGYQVVGSCVEFTGICPDCQEPEGENAA